MFINQQKSINCLGKNNIKEKIEYITYLHFRVKKTYYIKGCFSSDIFAYGI